ncbi:MAG: GrpB family protein [Thermomicrobiales bacterium]
MDEPPIRPFPFPGPPAALRPWDPHAPAAAAAVIALIADRLSETAIEHVGSSAVPGCAGKGYLDLVIPYRDAEHLAAINEALFALGFGRQRNRAPFPESRPMRIGAYDHDGQVFLLQVHVVPEGSGQAEELREFRDRLLADPTLIEAYVAAKQAIIDAGVRDGDDYARAKGQFITGLGFTDAEDA